MKYVVWTLLFDNSLDRLRETIPTFDFSNFASKDIIIPKAQHVLACAGFLVKLFKTYGS
jgi:hypothetical protein